MHWTIRHDSIAVLSIREESDGTLILNGYCSPPTLSLMGFQATVRINHADFDTDESRISINIGDDTYLIEVYWGRPFNNNNPRLIKHIDKQAEKINYPSINLKNYHYSKLTQISLVIYGMALGRL